MQFTCKKSDLLKAVSTVARAASTKMQNSIIECIYIECGDDLLTLKATNMSLSIKVTIQADTTEKGSCAAPTHILQSLISTFPESAIHFESRPNNKVKITCGESVTNISVLDADMFPSLPEIDADVSAVLPKTKFKSMIDQTIFSIAQAEDRPVFTGVMFDIRPDELITVGVDGYRMAVRYEGADTKGSKMCVIPGKALREASRCVDDEGDTDILIGDNMAAFKWDTTEIYTRLLDGDYLNYENLIPTSFSVETEVSVKPLKEAIERASVLAREGSNNIVRLNMRENEMKISSKTGNNSDNTEETIGAVTRGENLGISFNASYLLDVLKNISDDEITLKFNTPITPCVINKDGENTGGMGTTGGYTFLILPIQTHDNQ